MAVRELDVFHGIVLSRLMQEVPAAIRLVEHDANEYGVYEVDGFEGQRGGVTFYVKYSATPRPGARSRGRYWLFSFNEQHLDKLGQQVAAGPTYLALVCGKNNLKASVPPMQICILSAEEVANLIDLSSRSTEWIRVDYEPRKWLAVTGSELPKPGLKVPQNRLDAIAGGIRAA